MKNFLLKTSFVFLLIISLLFSANAQEAIKLGEVTRLRCDLGEFNKIYELKLQLDANPEYKGTVVVYGPQKGFSTNAEEVRRFFKFIKLENPERVSGYYGGFREQPIMELWIIPKGAKEPLINPIIQIKKAIQFDEYVYAKYSYCATPGEFVLKGFANELKQNPNFKAYIIGYGIKEKLDDEPLISLASLKRKLLNDKTFLIRLGIGNSRIKTIVFGYDNNYSYPRSELWIVPKGAEPPKPTLHIKSASNFVKD